MNGLEQQTAGFARRRKNSASQSSTNTHHSEDLHVRRYPACNSVSDACSTPCEVLGSSDKQRTTLEEAAAATDAMSGFIITENIVASFLALENA